MSHQAIFDHLPKAQPELINGSQKGQIIMNAARIWGRDNWKKELEVQLGQPYDTLTKERAEEVLEQLRATRKAGR
jgi:hypothetical protein